MKNLLLTIALLLMLTTGCGTKESQATSAPAPQKNFASEIVTAVEENAKCTDVFTGVGETRTHAAYCKLASKAIVYCSLDTQNGIRCAPLNGAAAPQSAPGAGPQGPQPGPGPQAQAPTPAPPAAPAPAPSK